MSKRKSLSWKKSQKSPLKRKLQRKQRVRHQRKRQKHSGLPQLGGQKGLSELKRDLRHLSRQNRKSYHLDLCPRSILRLWKQCPHLANRSLKRFLLKNIQPARLKIHLLSQSIDRPDLQWKRTHIREARKKLLLFLVPRVLRRLSRKKWKLRGKAWLMSSSQRLWRQKLWQ